MGSRRGRYAPLVGWLAAVGCSLASACKSTTPTGFSGGAGVRWTFPLVGALEDGLLLVPVSINSHGPYLFAIDQDASITAIDGEVVKDAELTVSQGPPRLDETDTPISRQYSTLVGLEIGTLIIEQRDAIVVRPHTFDAAGRRIHGVLGHDVFGDGLVFAILRDQGVGEVTVVEAFEPPPDAVTVMFADLPAIAKVGVPAVLPRRLVQARLNGETFPLHLDFGAVPSQLRDGLWDRAKLPAREVVGVVMDELGVAHKFSRASDPVKVEVETLSSERVAFVPYYDARWADSEVSGTLGLGFFAGYDVWLRYDRKQLLVRPRKSAPYTARSGRWETGPIHKCAQPGCVTLRVVDPLGGKPPPDGRPHPGVVLSITREERAGGMPLEVVLEVVGKPELPRLIVNMPANVDRLFDQLPVDYLGVVLEVRDASPFPRDCPSTHGCVDKIAR